MGVHGLPIISTEYYPSKPERAAEARRAVGASVVYSPTIAPHPSKAGAPPAHNNSYKTVHRNRPYINQLRLVDLIFSLGDPILQQRVHKERQSAWWGC